MREIKEEWKDIKGYENLYQVSNLGRVKSLDKNMRNNRGTFIKKGALKKLSLSNNGYLTVDLFKNNKGKTFLVHRLVAQEFILNPENKRTVNHKDGDKHNNSVINLEWNTYSENHKHSYDKLSRTAWMEGRTNELNPNSKAILMYSKTGELVCEFPSIMEAERDLNICNSAIVANLKGRSKTCFNHIFKYKSHE